MSARTEILETLRPMCRNTLRPYQYTCTQHRQRMRIQEQGNCSVQHQPFSNGQQACNSEVTSQRMLSHAHPLTYCRPRSSSRSAALGDLRHRDHDNLFQSLHFYRHHHPNARCAGRHSSPSWPVRHLCRFQTVSPRTRSALFPRFAVLQLLARDSTEFPRNTRLFCCPV